VGNTTEGGPGFGWDDDTDSELYPMDRKLAEQMAAEAVDAKADEQASKQDLLGGDLLNPFTGLSLADYLEGREVQHAQLVDQLVGRDNTSFVKELVGGARRGPGWLRMWLQHAEPVCAPLLRDALLPAGRMCMGLPVHACILTLHQMYAHNLHAYSSACMLSMPLTTCHLADTPCPLPTPSCRRARTTASWTV
jgi:hypothetical protein